MNSDKQKTNTMHKIVSIEKKINIYKTQEPKDAKDDTKHRWMKYKMTNENDENVKTHKKSKF
jgi:hypothetical protein